MKSRFLACMFLCVSLLALSAFAQQSTSTSGSPDASSPSVTSEREPLTAPHSKDFWDGDDPNLGNLIIHPFATKAYVRRQTVPIKDRINELDEITSENGTKIRDIDARSQKGLQMASEKVSLADQHATEAATSAQTAQTTATQVSTRLGSVEQRVGNVDAYKDAGQTEIHFRPGQSVLSKAAKDALDQMAAPLKDQHSYIIEVRGFAPGHGSAAVASSQKMSDSVVRYLVLTHKIPVYRIYVLNLGAAGVAATKRSAGSRVEVSVLKNDPVNTAQR